MIVRFLSDTDQHICMDNSILQAYLLHQGLEELSLLLVAYPNRQAYLSTDKLSSQLKQAISGEQGLLVEKSCDIRMMYCIYTNTL